MWPPGSQWVQPQELEGFACAQYPHQARQQRAVPGLGSFQLCLCLVPFIHPLPLPFQLLGSYVRTRQLQTASVLTALLPVPPFNSQLQHNCPWTGSCTHYTAMRQGRVEHRSGGSMDAVYSCLVLMQLPPDGSCGATAREQGGQEKQQQHKCSFQLPGSGAEIGKAPCH